MEIDVITLTDAQFALLTAEEILAIEEAQLKKNDLTLRLERSKRKEKYKLLENGVFRSPIFACICAELEKDYEAEVEAIRDGLLFYLRFAFSDERPTGAPYTVDYSLTYEERLAIVRTYYETTFSNASERYSAFQQDEVAKVYLGEYYAPLYDLFFAQTQ